MIKITVNTEHLARAFDRWMDEYTQNPQAFEAEFQTVTRFLKEMPLTTIKSGMSATSYGRSAAAFLVHKLEQVSKPKRKTRVAKKPSKKRRARVAKKAGRK